MDEWHKGYNACKAGEADNIYMSEQWRAGWQARANFEAQEEYEFFSCDER